MRFFKRGSSGPNPDAIPAFWHWWAGARDQVAARIADGSVDRMVGDISSAVDAIDRRLAWELAPGAHAEHALIVTPEGNPALRALAVAWLAAAPAADATWEYHAARQPRPLGRLALRGVDVDLADVRAIADWDDARQRLDVQLWHPNLTGQPDEVRHQAAFLFLDNLLGEDDVERWIGAIDALDTPITGWSPEELKAEVRRRAGQATGESWVLAERSDGGDAALVLANLALKPIDHPMHGHHLTVVVDRGLEQLAGSDELQELDAAEDRLVASMSTVGAVHAGHVTERRRRVIHFVCANPDPAHAVATSWATEERRFAPRVEVRHDPGWGFRKTLGL
jgi:hypothetical protein